MSYNRPTTLSFENNPDRLVTALIDNRLKMGIEKFPSVKSRMFINVDCFFENYWLFLDWTKPVIFLNNTYFLNNQNYLVKSVQNQKTDCHLFLTNRL